MLMGVVEQIEGWVSRREDRRARSGLYEKMGVTNYVFSAT
jgi:hypothetical protein